MLKLEQLQILVLGQSQIKCIESRKIQVIFLFFYEKKGHFWRLKRQVLILWEKNITSLRLRMI